MQMLPMVWASSRSRDALQWGKQAVNSQNNKVEDPPQTAKKKKH